jgi:DNA-binding NarL/FixJ family response regulator
MTQDLAGASSDGPRRREPLRVLLVDDVADLRLLLASLFGAYPGVEVIAEAGNGERAVELAVAHKPDLIVLDLAMPVLDGVGALPRLREASPASRIVVLTAIPRERDPGALAQGAAAYVEKSVATDRLVPDVLAGAGLLDTALTALGASRRVESEFPARTRSVASARAFAQRALDGWREGDLGDVVSLLLSELVTNAVVHAASAPNVAIHLLPDRVHVEVADDDSSQIRPQAVLADAEGGRGLTLVEALAHRWGQVTLPGGKVVWFEVLRSQ